MPSIVVRIPAAKDAFKKEHPYPCDDASSGPCPGYVIDHVKPLACGGADESGNMQRQTTAQGKAKDAWERNRCRIPGVSSNGYESSKIHVGPRGGRYVVTGSGNKHYLWY